MNFTLEGAAGGAQAIGSGLGNIFKAAAMGPAIKQQAEDARALTLAKIYSSNMSGNKDGMEAELKRYQLDQQKDPLANALLDNGVPLDRRSDIEGFINTGTFGPRYDKNQGPVPPAPATPETMSRIGKAMALYRRAIGTDSNVQQMANAQGEYQTQDFRNRAADAQNIEDFNRLISVAGNKVYTPFDNVGNTGVSINKATGNQVEMNPVLMKLFDLGETAQANQRNASAGASNAQAKKHRVETGIEEMKSAILDATGFLPGTRGSGSGGGDFSKERDDIRSDYNAEYPVDSMTRQRAKGAPTFDAYTRKWLAKYNIPEGDYFGSGAQKGANKNPPAAAKGNTITSNPPSIGTVTGAPAGAAIGSFVAGKGWQVKDKSGKVIGYAQE